MGSNTDTDTAFDPDLLIVETANGRVQGDHKRGVYRYKGIPYAAPPVGPRRFAPPVPAESWSGVRTASGKFPTVPQPLAGLDAMLGATTEPEQSESDGLTLHVWTQSPAGALRPVMVWIHGGAFVSGSGTIPWYDGTNLAIRDIVVVTLNYRLGALGFLHLEDLGGESYAGSGNAGLLDQSMALSWVHDNIEAFGGDPANVTIFGESAGGMSVATQLAMPRSRDLFHRAIAESGAAANVHDRDSATDIATRLLEAVGLNSNEVDRLREIPVDAILAAQNQVSADFSITRGLPFQPTVDGDFVPVVPIDAVRGGSAQGVDLLTGSNRDELKLFTALDPRLQSMDLERLASIIGRFGVSDSEKLLAVYREALPYVTPSELFEAMGTDAVFRMPAIELAETQSAHATSWLYEFHRASTSFGGSMGAAHAVEIPYVFDNLDSPGSNYFTGDATEEMRVLAASMADAWTSFARCGDPNTDGLRHWSNYDTEARTTMIFDLDPAAADDPARPFREAWATRR